MTQKRNITINIHYIILTIKNRPQNIKIKKVESDFILINKFLKFRLFFSELLISGVTNRKQN